MCMQATSSALVRAISPYFLSETRKVESVFVCFGDGDTVLQILALN